MSTCLFWKKCLNCWQDMRRQQERLQWQLYKDLCHNVTIEKFLLKNRQPQASCKNSKQNLIQSFIFDHSERLSLRLNFYTKYKNKTHRKVWKFPHKFMDTYIDTSCCLG